MISSRRIIFTPLVDLKDELANTGILITCYDRNGNGSEGEGTDIPPVINP